MDSVDQLLQYLIDKINSKNTTTLFLNGCPGVGKSYLLEQLSTGLYRHPYKKHIFGPYSIHTINTETIPKEIARDCCETGFLTQERLDSAIHGEWSLEIVFQQLTGRSHTFIVLIDIGNTSNTSIELIAGFFSSIRIFEGNWENSRIRVHFVITGYWDPLNLEVYYRNSNTSFPYTIAYNYFHLKGLSIQDVAKLVEQRGYIQNSENYGKVLHEITGGHPRICHEILDFIPKDKLSLSSMLHATRRAAEVGDAAKALVILWSGLPDDGKKFLVELMLKRQLSARILPELKNLLLAMGLVQEIQRGSQTYLSFRSWFVERVVRFHSSNLGIIDDRVNQLQIHELMPEITTLNNEAYEIVNDTENQIRNFVILQLCLMPSSGRHLLDIDIPQKKDSSNLYDRAIDWQKRSLEKNLPADLNPIITFLTTRELARLVNVISSRIKSNAWKKIAESIQEIADLRDSVMHNQLIDFSDLDRLIALQTQVYIALNQT